MRTAPEPSTPGPSLTQQGTLVLLVRHGETPTTGMVLPGRAPGLHLSERGRAQAERVAERLAGLSVSALYSSPLERARETAEPTAAGTGLAVQPGARAAGVRLRRLDRIQNFGPERPARVADRAAQPVHLPVPQR